MWNQIKTFLLLATLSLIILFIGSLFGRGALTIAFIFVLLLNIFSYYYSDKIVLSVYRTRPLPKSHWIYKETQKLAKKAGPPMPKVYISDFPVANAFATGRNPKHAAIVITTKLIDILNKEELIAVIGHELSHVKHRDILISTIVSVLAGTIMYIASMLRWSLFFGYRDRDQGIGNLIALLVIAIIAPFAALLIKLAISRSREFMADEGSAKLIGKGKPLADALIKLENQSKLPLRNSIGLEATENLFIVNPFSSTSFMKLFSTHPPVEERVKRLLKL